MIVSVLSICDAVKAYVLSGVPSESRSVIETESAVMIPTATCGILSDVDVTFVLQDTVANDNVMNNSVCFIRLLR